MSDEVDTPARIRLRNGLLEHFSAVNRAGSSGYASDEDLCPVRLQHALDPSPMSDLERGDSRPDSNRVEAQQTMTKHDWVLR